jgi:hypothetical protein
VVGPASQVSVVVGAPNHSRPTSVFLGGAFAPNSRVRPRTPWTPSWKCMCFFRSANPYRAALPSVQGKNVYVVFSTVALLSERHDVSTKIHKLFSHVGIYRFFSYVSWIERPTGCCTEGHAVLADFNCAETLLAPSHYRGK